MILSSTAFVVYLTFTEEPRQYLKLKGKVSLSWAHSTKPDVGARTHAERLLIIHICYCFFNEINPKRYVYKFICLGCLEFTSVTWIKFSKSKRM